MTEREFTEACKELTELLIAGVKGRCKDIHHFCGEYVEYDVWYNSKTRQVHFLLDGSTESINIYFPDAKWFRNTVLRLYNRQSTSAAHNFLHRRKREIKNY